MQTVLLYALLTTAAYYILAKAMITQWLWSRYSPAVDSFMQCPACSGTWYGLLVGLVGQGYLELDFLGVSGWWSAGFVALGAMVWTPYIAAGHDYAMRYLGGEVGSGS